ncbi:helix-turn-helix transcriptional regulator [Halalkalibacter krulwichiae]|uniref:HTH cro/C1-type domain-containing protein n=1 Tax=Halalkalibacter krulwichiae TaxID=199441 RepID=A0A1X9MEL5_9BACI|nr:helix-turn-helix transcriptional regulator [Halalkalibacter krulwichiae]ARK31856.1 hypothetical protein BkAM31D_19565 [Halalkalibacter krulwichiae]
MKLTPLQLKKVRKVYGLTFGELGALLNVTDAHLCNIEKGKRRLTDRLMLRLSHELELTDEKLERINSIYDEFKKGEFDVSSNR